MVGDKVQQYSSLHNHSTFSLLDGFSFPQEMLEQARKSKIKALAVTEHGNQYSWVYYYKLKDKYPDIKIIYGVELYECFDMKIQDANNKYFHLIALARNENGRKALNHIITQSNLYGFYYKPRVDLDLLKDYGNDLVISSACLASKLSREQDYSKCVEYINKYKKIFPYFYLEMQSHQSKDQLNYNKKILQLSQDTNTPYIITTDSHAASKEDLYYQNKLVQIAHDNETASEIYEGCYLQSATEIHEVMDGQIGNQNVDIGLKNTVYISDNLIEDVNMPFQKPTLPTYPLPNEFNDNYTYLKHLIELGKIKRHINKLSQYEQKKYQKRIDYELNIIHNMGFDGYFLIVWDFINYAKSQDVMIGAGRGSGAGSLICYIIGITELDPLKYGLIFERFLNPERISMPDLDIDVSNREIVINYLIKKYGENNVCQIINFSYITPIIAIKDVGKILGFKYNEMDKLSKRFTYDTFNECIEHNRVYLEENPRYDELINIASKLSGRIKTVSCHAGGVGIVDTKIDDYMGMKLGSDNEHVIQVDKRIIEEIGIIKFDILGVKTLDLVKNIIHDCNLSLNDININNPTFENDQQSYNLLQKALTNGVFQVESAGMKDLLVRLKPNCLEDLSAILALYRPDSMGALEDYIYYKHHPKEIKYIHPNMKPILESTYGCMIYQEQLMDIVRVFGGRSYGGADKFRKGIGKKDKELVQKESIQLYQEIMDNGYSQKIAQIISDDMKTKGGYLFNKSHSYSYAVLCFQTAYLKTYYSAYFYKSLFNINKSKAGMLNKYIIDAKLFEINVLPPHINKSDINFTVINNEVLFGLSAISGIGENLAEQIISFRCNGFKSINDLCDRVNLNKTQIISLIKSGAIPTKNKKKMLMRYLMKSAPTQVYKSVSTLPTHKKLKNDYNLDVEQYRQTSNNKINKVKLLSDYNYIKKQKFEKQINIKIKKYQHECSKKYLSNEPFWEFEALQIFINNNPFDKAYKHLTSFDEIENKATCTVAGIIAKVQKKKDKNKKQFAFINIYSSFGLIEGIVWHSTLKQFEDLIKKGQQIVCLGVKENDDKIVIKDLKSYQQWLLEKEKEGVML